MLRRVDFSDFRPKTRKNTKAVPHTQNEYNSLGALTQIPKIGSTIPVPTTLEQKCDCKEEPLRAV